MIVVVSTENFGDFKGFPVLNAFQETLILDTVCTFWFSSVRIKDKALIAIIMSIQ